MIEVHGIRAVVTDIEGTTSSLAFVKDVLFPYARQALPDFVRGHQAQLKDIASDMAAIVGKPQLDSQEMIDVLLQWMAEDRKITPLKTLQGMVWKIGYESGELQSHLYEDAALGLRKWHADGLRLHVYSSGSIAAQKLLFAHTAYGNLLPLFSGYFDTTTGPKLEARSYQAITVALGLTPQEIVFLSDHAGEIQAAHAAGLRTVLLARERSEANAQFARSFDDIQLRCSREN